MALAAGSRSSEELRQETGNPLCLCNQRAGHLRHGYENVFTPDDRGMKGEIEYDRHYKEKVFNKIIEIKEREPATRKKLLEGLTEKGFRREQRTEMQRMIDAEKSDLFDVLANVAYALAHSKGRG